MARTGRGKGRPAARGSVAKASGRYTPPIPRKHKVSPPWVPVLMFTLLIVGAIIVMTGYFVLQPGGVRMLVLLVGLIYVAGGFITVMRYR